jgi:hypothetical protein
MEGAQAVLDAIKAFEKEHGRDPKFRHVFSALADAEDGLSRLVRQGRLRTLRASRRPEGGEGG